MAKISVLGSGSWGMALALLLHNNGHEVLLWSARPEDARKLREKEKILTGFQVYRFRKTLKF